MFTIIKTNHFIETRRVIYGEVFGFVKGFTKIYCDNDRDDLFRN